ncbi:hypothetical protein [Paenibacillus bovis]|uniref:DUF4190 domain-containing protein n=1 Tax=Paenibacillus bovis TaxID=1616788 RepID=A0A172ZDD2_9BACL|nr:hypothetical protein [Paenibacillus bovis]ANF95362.1 hypothetical protein AR543_04580 [Paenibacillus bovis]
MNEDHFGQQNQPYQTPPPPPGYRPPPSERNPDQPTSKDRFVMALTSFILSLIGLISMSGVVCVFILLVVANAEFGVVPMLVIMGLVISAAIILLSLVFAILSLRSSRGRGFAITSLTIGLLQIVGWAGFIGLANWIE